MSRSHALRGNASLARCAKRSPVACAMRTISGFGENGLIVRAAHATETLIKAVIPAKAGIQQ